MKVERLRETFSTIFGFGIKLHKWGCSNQVYPVLIPFHGRDLQKG